MRGARRTTGDGPAPRPPVVHLHALIISDHLVATHPLPDHGEVRIGRSPTCELLVDDPVISRTHAAIAVGETLRLRDLGSVNGTRVRGRALEPDEVVEIAPGDPIEVGSTLVIIQRRAAPIRPRRLWTHDYFEVRLEEECARAARRGDTFGVVRLTGASDPDVALEALTDAVRLSDVVGEYGPLDYELLLVDTPPEQLDATIERLLGALQVRGVTMRAGVACYPRDGRSADALMASAGARVQAHTGARTPVVAERTMEHLYDLARRIAPGSIGVLILGETGVGKEVLAEQVHRLSPRADRPYLRLHCAALTETLLESELFGHERGAFTGAVAAKPGLLESADGGTVFLDEVGELPPSTQVKLLRVIEERKVRRVGGLKARPLDVRFIAATNRDLEAEVARGAFRQDLYFRLNGATLVIPPLRERMRELPELARGFLEQAAHQAGLSAPPELSPEALAALEAYRWPGNIRELRNMIERAVLLSGGEPIGPRHLPLEKMRVTFSVAARRETTPRPPPSPSSATAATPRLASVLRRGAQLTHDEERARIEEALATCGGNQTRAAALLGIARRTLINRLEEHGLVRPRKARR